MRPLPAQAAQLLGQVAQLACEDFEPAMRGYLALLQQLTGMESVMLLVIDYDGAEPLQQVKYVDFAAANIIAIAEGDVFPWTTGGCRLLRQSRRNFSTDMQADYPDFALGEAIGLHAYLSLPIEVGPDQRLVGTLCGMQPCPYELAEETLEISRVLSQLVSARFDREAQLSAERARISFAGEQLHTWVEAAVAHEHLVRTDLMVISGLVTLVRDGGSSVLLQSAVERLANLEAEVVHFAAHARATLHLHGAPGETELVELIGELNQASAVARLGQDPCRDTGQAWVRAQPEVVRRLVELLVGHAVEPRCVPSVAVLEECSLVVITTAGNLRTLSMSVLRVLVAGLNGQIAWQTLPDGSGHLEISLPTVPAPLRL